MHDAPRVARVRDAGRQASRDIEALLHFTQHQQPAIGRKVTTIKTGDHGLAANG
jgi:hypothetical protein